MTGDRSNSSGSCRSSPGRTCRPEVADPPAPLHCPPVAMTSRRPVECGQARRAADWRARSLQRDGVFSTDKTLSLCRRRDDGGPPEGDTGDTGSTDTTWYHRSVDAVAAERAYGREASAGSRSAFSEGELAVTQQCGARLAGRPPPETDSVLAGRSGCDGAVRRWLDTLQLKDTQKYARIFGVHEVDMASLRLLKRTRLQQMGVVAFGPLSKMTAAINDLKGADLHLDPVWRGSSESSPTSEKSSCQTTARTPDPRAERRVGGRRRRPPEGGATAAGLGGGVRASETGAGLAALGGRTPRPSDVRAACMLCYH